MSNVSFVLFQIGSNCSKPSANTGVKIPTCKFRIRDIFTTSPGELYRVFLNQEVQLASTNRNRVLLPVLIPLK